MTIDTVAQIERPEIVAIAASHIRHAFNALTHGRAIIVGDPGRNRR
jgi:hypothetical protein